MEINTLKSRYYGIQDMFRHINTDGCLFLSLCSIIEEVTEKPADIIGIIQKSMKEGWLSDDYEVRDSLALLGEFTGKKWKRIEAPELPQKIEEWEFTIEKWFNPRTGFTHFKRRFTDTLFSSATVKFGKIKEYYIYSYRR